MENDLRFTLVKEFIEKGKDILKFKDIFSFIPVSVMAKRAGISKRLLQDAVDKPDEQKLDICFRVAEALAVNAEKIYQLVEFQIRSEYSEERLIEYNLKPAT